MLAAFALLVALLPFSDSSRTSTPFCVGGQTVEQDEVEASGAVRLAGLLRLLDAPRRQTTHGFLWPTLFGEAAPGTPAQTALVIDGEPLAPDLRGLGDLERFPADVPDVQRLTYCPGPLLIDGRMWEGGALYIQTRQREGIRGAVFIGNEVGDPGPFRYLIGNRNIDKFGPDYAGAAVWRGASASADARFKIRRFYATDPEIANRTARAAGAFPRQRFVSGEARGQVEALGGWHRASVMASGGSLLAFQPTLGQEVPLRPIWAQASVAGTVPVRPRVRASYRIRQSYDRSRTFNPAFPVDLRWTAYGTHGLLALSASRGDLQLSGGASADRVWLPDGAPSGYTLGRAHLGAQTPRYGATVVAVTGPSGVGGSGLIRLNRSSVQGEFSAQVSAARTLPEEAGGLAYWQHRGYAGFQLETVERSAEPPVAQDAVRLRVEGHRSLGPARLSSTAGLRAARGVGIEQARFAPLDSLMLPTGGRARFVADASGVDAYAGVSASGRRGLARLRLFADVRGAVSGTGAFRESWRTVPMLQTGGRLSLHPHPSFSAFTSLEARSATRWAAYDRSERQRIPPVVLMDAALQKSLWGDRLKASLLFRNLLSAPERYQQRGVVLDLRLYARAVLHLP